MREVTLQNAPALLAEEAEGGRVFLPGGPLEPVALYDAFQKEPHHAADIAFCGMMMPGINTRDWASLYPNAKAEVFLPSPDLATTIASGQTRVFPLHYSAAWRHLSRSGFDAAVFHVCPPDNQGLCNASLSADCSEGIMGKGMFKLAVINHGLPRILGAPSFAITNFDAIVEIDEPPITLSAEPTSDIAAAIAGHVATLVSNGATIQAGIGKLPAAAIAALVNHGGLKLHSGLIGDWALDLLAAGAFTNGAQALTAGAILGSEALHQALAEERRLRLLPISFTHEVLTMPQNDFTSINGALEIDLYGQINCEFAGACTLSGVGGALDFLRGARASLGGKPIVMIAAQGKGGVSRIVPRLRTPCVSIARCDPPILVTEHGSIDLEPLDTQARARAIISLAGVAHRDALTAALKDMPL